MMVYMRKTPNSKLSVPFRGPFKVEKVKGYTIWVKLPEGLKFFHSEEVKPLHAHDAIGPNFATRRACVAD